MILYITTQGVKRHLPVGDHLIRALSQTEPALNLNTHLHAVIFLERGGRFAGEHKC